MQFVYGKQELRCPQRAQEVSFLLTNGLGGYCSATAAFSVPRSDQGILVAAVTAPNRRITLVHRLRECLHLEDRAVFLSTQGFAGGQPPEDGWRHVSSFAMEYTPCWRYQVGGVLVERRVCMAREENTAAVVYTVENRSPGECTLEVSPRLKFAPKEESLTRKGRGFHYKDGCIRARGHCLYIKTDGLIRECPPDWERLSYPEDKKDGRPGSGLAGGCCTVTMTVQAGKRLEFEIVFSTEPEPESGRKLLEEQEKRLKKLEEDCGLRSAQARQLAMAADAFIARRDSTGGKTILAGYPLFSDWGRDTMIALPGCCLAARRYDDAKSILRTFLAYEKDGLVPNLFPEGESAPMYNTVDAALLLIDCVWQYIRCTGDEDFLREAYPVLERIVAAYRAGTHHSIRMDADGLIAAGSGLDQVTWMDVCVNGILPTPRLGKPVEVNAYWYNALRVMETFSQRLGLCRDYGELAGLVKKSFIEQFLIPEKGYLRDVLSGTAADEQLRCNQIWAVSQSFSMLDKEQERSVVDAVYRHLYTPCGLRTLAPEDAEYRGFYGGPQVQRDMAYHQGTTWVFPLGAYYLAFLKVHGNSREAAQRVREDLTALEPMLREGCAGQLPEIYDGDFPAESKGCFAQAWSVGELLRVWEQVERILGE